MCVEPMIISLGLVLGWSGSISHIDKGCSLAVVVIPVLFCLLVLLDINKTMFSWSCEQVVTTSLIIIPHQMSPKSILISIDFLLRNIPHDWDKFINKFQK